MGGDALRIRGRRGTGPFKAVITEVERRQGNWVVVRLDRRKTELETADAGFKVVRDAA